MGSITPTVSMVHYVSAVAWLYPIDYLGHVCYVSTVSWPCSMGTISARVKLACLSPAGLCCWSCLRFFAARRLLVDWPACFRSLMSLLLNFLISWAGCFDVLLSSSYLCLLSSRLLIASYDHLSLLPKSQVVALHL